MRITLNIPEFTRIERNSHCDVLHITPAYMLSLRNANAGDFSVYSVVWPLTRKSARIAARNYHSIKDIGDNVCDNAA